MKSSIVLSKKFPIIVVNRIGLFFFLMCFFTAFFYTLGTFQGFMDATQFVLLKLTVVLGVLLAVFSLCGLILEMVFLLGDKKLRYLGGFFYHVFLVIFGGAAAFAALFFIVVSGGNAGP